MSKAMSMGEMSMGSMYRISGFEEDASEYAEKLSKMGFVKGTPVELAHVKMSDPIVIQVRGSRVALRKTEASRVLVEAM